MTVRENVSAFIKSNSIRGTGRVFTKEQLSEITAFLFDEFSKANCEGRIIDQKYLKRLYEKYHGKHIYLNGTTSKLPFLRTKDHFRKEDSRDGSVPYVTS